MNSISTKTGARQGRGTRGRGSKPRLRKPVVAVVLAGGAPHPGFGPEATPFRPLLPFRGRPIVAHLLDALEASGVRPRPPIGVRALRAADRGDRGRRRAPGLGGRRSGAALLRALSGRLRTTDLDRLTAAAGGPAGADLPNE